MEIVVPVKMVPDLVEELEVDESGRALDRQFLKLRLNEFDEHALEEALLLKAQHGGTVTVIALEGPEVDEALFTCLAKGADRAVKVAGDFEEGVTSRAAATVLGAVLRGLPHDLILTGVQAADDRDGQVGIFLASALDVPHVSVVSGVELASGGRAVLVRQEYAGGVMAELEVDLPAVLGIQAARETPRYAPVSKVRQMMKTAKLETVPAPTVAADTGAAVRRLLKPEAASAAQMLDGSPEEIAAQLLMVFRERGLLPTGGGLGGPLRSIPQEEGRGGRVPAPRVAARSGTPRP